MGLSNYTELKASIANFLARDGDTTVTDKIPDFISLAEARMNRILETRSQVTRVTGATVADDEFIPLPTALRMLENVKLETDPVTVLDYVTPYQLYNEIPSSSTGKPKYYSVVGTEIALRPIPDKVYSITLYYRNEIAALSDGNAFNTVLRRHPDAYLYGALSAASIYLMDDQRAAQFDSVFTRTMDEIVRDTQNGRYGGSLTIRSEY